MKMSKACQTELNALLDEANEIGHFEFMEEHHGEGVCFNCGAARWECEPDAEKYECDKCGEKAVYGLLTAFLQYC
jgi:hypothetical protein